MPAGETEQSWFVKEVERGLHVRYPAGIPAEVRARADFETDVIVQMGFPGYFLVVADFINWAKENGIRVGPGRGSGAGSMAAYAMRITDLDPLQHGLLFERFLNPDRVSMPDFDIDFDDRRRGEVIQYVTEKYGDERVAQIVTYGTIKAKQALKDAGRVLGFPFSMGERLTKAMPPAVMGKDMPLEGMFDKDHPRFKEASEFRALIETDAEAKTVFDTAVGLENLKRQWGVHAAGVIMSSEPLIDIIPIMKREQDGQIVTQFDYPACESLGLIKMDFLGLRNLTIIDDALDNIAANRGEKLVLEDLALDDAASYELLARGDTLGVFQLDGGPMRSLLRLMKPDNFEDISAVLALYRPGPMGVNSHTNYALRKNGLQQIEPIHPELEAPLADILGTTYGLIVYQEQVMAAAQKLAGFSLGQADILRRAMGKKKKSELDKQQEDFFGGMTRERLQPGRPAGAVEGARVLRRLRLQQGAHRGVRAHRLLDRVPEGALPGRVHGRAADERRRREGQARRLPQRVPPHGHQGAAARRAGSRSATSPPSAKTSASGSARCATSARTSSTPSSLARQDGAFESFHDFLAKVPVHVANKRTVESLIKAGAFDSLGSTRRALMEIHEDATEAGRRGQAQGGHRRDRVRLRQPVRRDRGAAPGEGARSAGVDEEGQAGVRARDARALRLGSPARGSRDPAGQARVDQHPRPARLRGPQRRRPGHRRGARHERAAPRREIQRQSRTA